MSPWVYVIVILFLIFVFGVGIFTGKGGSNDEESYYTGNKGFGALPSAISEGATNSSGWIFIGACGWAYAVGAASMWMCVGFLVAGWINYAIIAPRLWHQSKKLGAMDISDYFEKRLNHQWGNNNVSVKVVGAVILALFFLPYMSSQLTSAGKTLQTIINIDYNAALIFAGVFVTAFCFTGGYKSVIYTDMVQGLLMLAIFLILPVYLIFGMFGGWHNFWQTIYSIDPLMTTSAYGDVGAAGFSFALGWILYGVGGIGQPHIQQRFITARDDKTLKQIGWIGMVWLLAVMAGSNLLGICGRILCPTIADPEFVFPTLVAENFNPIITGLVIGGILGAIMTTYSSQLMVEVQSVASDILTSVSKKTYTEEQKVKIGHITMIVCAILSILIALMNIDTVFALVNFAWSGVAAAFAPMMLLLFVKPEWVTKEGAIAGMISGCVVSSIWYAAGWSSFLHEIAPGLLVSTVVILVVSKISKKNYTKA